MQDFSLSALDFFLLSLPQARLAEVPPERLPRRAVRGLGAHSPHQTDFVGFSLCEVYGVGK
jgi:hypothetical protein